MANVKATRSAVDMEERYKRASKIQKGVLNRSYVPNDILFPHWVGDTNCFWYERVVRDRQNTSTESRVEYRMVDAVAQCNELAFDHEALANALSIAAQREVFAHKLPIESVDFDLTPLRVRFTAFDRRWVFDAKSAECAEAELRPQSWLISPDRKRAVFVKDFNLVLRVLDTGEERNLTEDGCEDWAYGMPGDNYAASSDVWGYLAQACWSPDGKQVLTVVRDTRNVKVLPVVQHVPLDGTIRPKVVNCKIALPGDDSVPEYALLAIDIESGDIQKAQYPAIPALNNGRGFFTDKMGWWALDSRRAYFVDQTRDHRTINVVEFDTASGQTRVVFSETSATHLSMSPGMYMTPAFWPIQETNELVWWSERTGWGHLYLYDLNTGDLKRTLTKGEWLVYQVLRFDFERKEIFVQTAGRVPGRDPYYNDLCRVHLDTGNIFEIASSDHDYIASSKRDFITSYAKSIAIDVDTSSALSPDGEFAVVTRSRVDQESVSVLLDRKGSELLTLERADVSELPASWQWPEPVKLKAADGKTDTYGVVFRPSDFSASNSYPVVALGHHMPDVIVSPKGSFMSDSSFFGIHFNYAAALAELGFIVVTIDGRGTPRRDKRFQDDVYGRVLSGNLMKDEVAGIRQLAERYPYIDLERVGSACLTGGPGAVRGLLEHPDFYKVGVSVVQHDPRLMPCTVMGDKFEGPFDERCDHQYPEDLVENLRGKLLLINGMLDTGNPVACLLRLTHALEMANKDFDMHVSAGGGHGASNFQLRRCWDYLVRHLMGAEPPKEFALDAHDFST